MQVKKPSDQCNEHSPKRKVKKSFNNVICYFFSASCVSLILTNES